MPATDDYSDLPTPRSTLAASYVTVRVWCKGGCHHQSDVDLAKLIEAEKGVVPLSHLQFHCSKCGSRPFQRGITTNQCPTRRTRTCGRPTRRCVALLG
jgi:hypothetical protein